MSVPWLDLPDVADADENRGTDGALDGDSSSSSSWFIHLQHIITDVLSDSSSSPELALGEVQAVRVSPSEAWRAHQEGNCNPCVLFVTQQGCKRSDNCRYCHMDHTNKKPASKRPRKHNRDKHKAQVHQFLQEQGERLQEEQDAQDRLQELAEKNIFIRNMLQVILDGLVEERLLATQLPIPATSSSGALLRVPGPQPPTWLSSIPAEQESTRLGTFALQ